MAKASPKPKSFRDYAEKPAKAVSPKSKMRGKGDPIDEVHPQSNPDQWKRAPGSGPAATAYNSALGGFDQNQGFMGTASQAANLTTLRQAAAKEYASGLKGKAGKK